MANLAFVVLISSDRKGKTPLSEASKYGLFDMSSLLLANGANPAIADRDGRRPQDRTKNSAIQDLFSRYKELKPKTKTYGVRIREEFPSPVVYLKLNDGRFHGERQATVMLPMEIWNLIGEHLNQHELSNLTSVSKEFSSILLDQLLKRAPTYKIILIWRQYDPASLPGLMTWENLF